MVTLGIGIANCASKSERSTWLSISCSAVSIFRSDVVVTRPRADPTAPAVSKVPSVVAMIGSRSRSPATSAPIDRCNSNPPLRMMHDNDGNPSAAWALATASTTSERSPGVTTAEALAQPFQHVVGRHAGDNHTHHFTAHQLRCRR